jgi:hypothetical protein
VLAFAATRGVRPTSARAFVSKLRHVGRAFLLGRRLRARYRVAGPGVIGSVVGHSGLNITCTTTGGAAAPTGTPGRRRGA